MSLTSWLDGLEVLCLPTAQLEAIRLDQHLTGTCQEDLVAHSNDSGHILAWDMTRSQSIPTCRL